MEDLPAFYEDLIKIQRKEIRGWWIWVICVASGGAAIITSNLIFTSGTNLDLIRLMGGAFIGVCAAYPYKNIPPRRERIATYINLKRFFEATPLSEEEKRQLLVNLGTEALRVALQRGPNA